MATFCTVCVRVSSAWNIWYGYFLYSLCASVWCVDCLVWLRSVQFVWEVSGVRNVFVATFCTVCVRVSGVWNVVVATVYTVFVGSVCLVD